MNKNNNSIIVKLTPFLIEHKLFVTYNSKVIPCGSYENTDLPNAILSLSEQYNITTVLIEDRSHYKEKLIQQLKQREQQLYNCNKLEIGEI